MAALLQSLALATDTSAPVTAPRADRDFVAVDGLTIDYVAGAARVRAVESVSFRVARGERIVLLGPSGCGKSTILRAIGGFLKPSSGSIRVDGAVVQSAGPDRVMVFQEFDQLLPWKTVLENVAFPLRLGGVAKHQARQEASAILSTVGLAHALNAYPHTLSGGMKQRVAIARALVTKPKLVLMDEPFASLDAFNRRRLQEELVELATRFGLTVVFVTHAIDEALLVGTRLLLLTPHPGRSAGEFDAMPFGFAGAGSPAFYQAQRIIEQRLAVGREHAIR